MTMTMSTVVPAMVQACRKGFLCFKSGYISVLKSLCTTEVHALAGYY